MVEVVFQDFAKNKEMYSKIKYSLINALGENVPVNHVGSSAIPNMVGKNIIDVLVGAKDDKQFQQFREIISKEGYFASKNNTNPIYQFFASKEEETSAGDVHIHLAIIGTERYDEFLLLRDYLLQNESEAQAYACHKKELVKLGVIDRANYRNTKSQYVSALIERAKKYFDYK